ncbi:hypothetical protein Cci01nite_25050 [Catellatospora citrea]|uniref:Uncharacterized protein n=1 Tax=Catellatospora citrea TaxID=53366 RepID=A0A8J3KCC9_9ACTN|nr:hypothetical protein Cci01nite_25050 [Catellatospora citrea]
MIRAIDDATRAEHERWVAEVRSWADAARERGDEAAARRYLAQTERLEGIPKPWENQQRAA